MDAAPSARSFFIITGTFLRGGATIIIVAPLFLPVASNLGIDLIHYGMIIMICQAIGRQTHSVASVLLTVASVSEAPLEEILRWVGIFLLAFLAALGLVTYVPIISTCLPGLVNL